MRFSLIILLSLFMVVACSNKKDIEKKDKKINKQLTKEEARVKELLTLNENEMLAAIVSTTMGDMEIELYPDKAPKTVENFVGLATKGYYDGIIFHRVIDQFMIQGGDPSGTGTGGQSYFGKAFEDEFHDELRHTEAGILSMANAGPNTNGSQFFITLVPTPWLDGKHSIFGKVFAGIDVVESIGKVPTSKPFDKPVKDVVMNKVTIEKRTK